MSWGVELPSLASPAITYRYCCEKRCTQSRTSFSVVSTSSAGVSTDGANWRQNTNSMVCGRKRRWENSIPSFSTGEMRHHLITLFHLGSFASDPLDDLCKHRSTCHISPCPTFPLRAMKRPAFPAIPPRFQIRFPPSSSRAAASAALRHTSASLASLLVAMSVVASARRWHLFGHIAFPRLPELS